MTRAAFERLQTRASIGSDEPDDVASADAEPARPTPPRRRIEERPRSRRRAGRLRRNPPPPISVRAAGGRHTREFLDQPRFPHPCLAGDYDHARVSGGGVIEPHRQPRQLLLTSDEYRAADAHAADCALARPQMRSCGGHK
jgi:hypothetical protein